MLSDLIAMRTGDGFPVVRLGRRVFQPHDLDIRPLGQDGQRETQGDEPAQRKLDEQTAALIARLRISMEGQEGLSAFLEKRPPNWL